MNRARKTITSSDGVSVVSSVGRAALGGYESEVGNSGERSVEASDQRASPDTRWQVDRMPAQRLEEPWRGAPPEDGQRELPASRHTPAACRSRYLGYGMHPVRGDDRPVRIVRQLELLDVALQPVHGRIARGPRDVHICRDLRGAELTGHHARWVRRPEPARRPLRLARCEAASADVVVDLVVHAHLAALRA